MPQGNPKGELLGSCELNDNEAIDHKDKLFCPKYKVFGYREKKAGATKCLYKKDSGPNR